MSNPLVEYPDLLPEERCFAFKGTGYGRYECIALNTSCCKGKDCHTYKTEKQCKQEQEYVKQRINSLPDIERIAIYDKYGARNYE